MTLQDYIKSISGAFTKPVKPRNFGRPINRIVIHTTATTQSATVEAIKNYWKNNLGWDRVGYHYIIGVNGERHILSHLSHYTYGVRGFNWDSVHISYIGGKNGDDRTDKQKEAMKKLIQELRADDLLGKIPVVGHRDLSPDLNGNGIIEKHEWVKRCPSFEVSEWLVEANVL
jgi:N-acetylmuramoyl-L-alanine amidase